MRPRISIRGCVRPSVGPLVRQSIGRSVGPSVRNAFVKIAENGVMQDEGASRAVYPALFHCNRSLSYLLQHTGSGLERLCSPGIAKKRCAFSNNCSRRCLLTCRVIWNVSQYQDSIVKCKTLNYYFSYCHCFSITLLCVNLVLIPSFRSNTW